MLELLKPENGTVIPLAPTDLSWVPMPDATSYMVQIARDVEFADKVFERHASFSRLTINQSFGSGVYYWK